MHSFFKKGMGLIEVLVGVTIITVGIISLIISFNSFVSYALANDKNTQAAYLLQEGLEGVTFLRDMGWSADIAPLSTTTTYYLAWNSSSSYWQATTTKQYIDTIFLRHFIVSDVMRDGSGHITTSNGTYDPGTKEITMTIDYSQGHATTTKTISTYIADLFSN